MAENFLDKIKHHKKTLIGSVAASVGGTLLTVFVSVSNIDTKQALSREEQITQPLANEIYDLRVNTIKRNSFDQYIRRKDTEYHNQTTLNDRLQEELGQLQGEVKEDDALLNRIAAKVNDP